MKIAIHRLARQDLSRAAKWYDRQRSGLGDEFLNTVNSAVEWVRHHSNTGIDMGGGVRMSDVKRFPYGIVFEPSTGLITILSFHHHKRRGGYWHRRRRNR
jgi:toxin ParE1/3/4